MHSNTVLLVGTPNSGKTTLFNALTGLNGKVGNFPGSTVEFKVGKIKREGFPEYNVVDLPGLYSLRAASEDEELTKKVILGQVKELKNFSFVALVIDISELRRGLYLYLQLCELGLNVVILLTKLNDSNRNIDTIIEPLKRATKAIIIPCDFTESRFRNLSNQLQAMVQGVLKFPFTSFSLLDESEDISQLLLGNIRDENIDHSFLTENLPPNIIANRAFFLWSIKELQCPLQKQEEEKLKQFLAKVPQIRFEKIDKWLLNIENLPQARRKFSDIIDRVLLHPLSGGITLFLFFAFFIQMLFWLSSPMEEVLENIFANVHMLAKNILPAEAIFTSLILDGVLPGIGTLFTFVPLLSLLFLFLAFLEESGYFARIVFLLDSLLKKIGLNGRSVVPFLGAFSCAIPAVVSTRIIGDKRARLLSIFVLPFITCSARLPVFGLIIGSLFASNTFASGALFAGLYFFGVIAAIFSAFIISKFLPKEKVRPLNIDLPPFKMVSLLSLWKRVFERLKLFLSDMVMVILAATIAMWALFYFGPTDEGKFFERASNIEESFGGYIGKSVEPIFKPLGFDWQISTSIVASFAAREVFVSTLALTYGLESSEDKKLSLILQEKIKPLTGITILVFFTLAMQCMSTIAVVAKETRSIKIASLQFLFMSSFAYLASLLVAKLGAIV